MSATVLDFGKKGAAVDKKPPRAEMGLEIVEVECDCVRVYFEPGGRKLTLKEAYQFALSVVRGYTLEYMVRAEEYNDTIGSYVAMQFPGEMPAPVHIKKALDSQRGWAKLFSSQNLHDVLDRVSRNTHAHCAPMTRACAEELVRRLDPAMHKILMRECGV